MEQPKRVVTDNMMGLKLPDHARLSARVATVLGHNPGPFTGPPAPDPPFAAPPRPVPLALVPLALDPLVPEPPWPVLPGGGRTEPAARVPVAALLATGACTAPLSPAQARAAFSASANPFKNAFGP